MTPVQFSCETTLALAPLEVAEKILDVANWADFQGYGSLPGIKAAEFELKTPDVVGSRIRVQNTDGSSHVEEITAWDMPTKIQLRMAEFSAQLSRVATGIDETWEFNRLNDATHVVRSFSLQAQSVLTRPLLWLISKLLKRAIDRHLIQMRDAASS